MTREEILSLTDREFRDWMVRLAKDNRISDIYAISKIRISKKASLRERKDID